MTNLIWALLPNNYLFLVILVASIGLMLGLLKRKTAIGLVWSVILLFLFSPFINALTEFIPDWLLLLLSAIFFLSLIQAVLRGLFGKGVSDQLMANLLWSLFTLPFKALGFVLRIGRRRYDF